MRWLIVPLLLLGGCFEYEIVVETVVSAAGNFTRTLRIRESSDKPQTWARYAPPAEPYSMTGGEAEGFVAQAEFRPGTHPGGLRIVAETPEGEYGGAEAVAAAPTFEGSVRVVAHDLGFGTVYRYDETVDFGLDRVAFREELDFALDVLLDWQIAALELIEPELDFDPARAEARKSLLPVVRSALLSMHAQLLSLAESGIPIRGDLPLAELRRDPRFRVFLRDLERLGIRRRPDAPDPDELKDFFEDDFWMFDATRVRAILRTVEGVDEARADAILARMATAGKQDEKGEPSLLERAWKRAVPDERKPAVEKRLEKFGRTALGAHVMHNMFDNHDITVRVTLPGKILRTNGQLHDAPRVMWRLETAQFVNPRLFACSFAASESMVGRIRDADRLLRFAEDWSRLTDEERAPMTEFLAAAKKDGLAAALKKAENENWKALKSLDDVLAEK